MRKKFDAAALLRKAANFMEKRGHAKGDLVTPDGRVCLAGAINLAANRDPVRWNEKTNRLLRRVENYLSRKAGKPLGYFHAVSWNNRADTRSKEVIAALRGAARTAR